MDIVKRLRRTRATMLGTDDEQHFSDCHEAADEIERLRHAMLTAARRLEKGGDEYGVGYELRVAMTPTVQGDRRCAMKPRSVQRAKRTGSTAGLGVERHD